MQQRQRIILFGCIGLAAVMVAVGAIIAYERRPQLQSLQQHPVSKKELAVADGKHGHRCYVAIDGTVYQIVDSAFWQNGKHTPSEGLAYCGADLSKVIDQSPHGRNVLNILPIIGPLRK